MSHLPAETSPEVPSPLLVAAWEKLGLLAAERVPLWAAYWLVGGHDGEALAYLAGLRGDDPREIHDALPDALSDCGVEMPGSDVAAAAVAFTHAARLHLAGLEGPDWVVSQVDRVVALSDHEVMDLPLGRLWLVVDEWGAGWSRTDKELAQVIREACEEQLRDA